MHVYNLAGVGTSKTIFSLGKGTNLEIINSQGNKESFEIHYASSKRGEETRRDNLLEGDILSIVYTGRSSENKPAPHNVIFIKWIDKEKKIAKLFDWNNYKDGKKLFGYFEYDLSNNKHPVYSIWEPVLKGSSVKDNEKEEEIPQSGSNLISEEIHLVFEEKIDDHVFIRWNWEKNKLEVLVFPNGELKKGILEKQKWSSEKLQVNSFDNWMTRQNIQTINNLLSASSIEDLEEKLVESVILENDLYIYSKEDTFVRFGETSSVDEIKDHINSCLNERSQAKELPAKNTIFSNKVRFSGDVDIGVSHTFYFRFDFVKNKWRSSLDKTESFPADWDILTYSSANSKEVFSLELADFEQGVLLLTEMYGVLNEGPGAEAQRDLAIKQDTKEIYYGGENTGLYLKREDSGFFVYQSESFIFDWLNPDSKMGVFIVERPEECVKFRTILDESSNLYKKNSRILKVLESSCLEIVKGKFIFKVN